MNKLLTSISRMIANVVIHLLGWDAHIVRWLRKKLRFTKKEAKSILRHFIRQHVWLALSYTVLPWVVFVAGLFFMGLLASVCADTPFDWSAWIDALPQEIKYFVAVLLFWGPPVVIGTVVYRRQRRKLRNIIERSLTMPLCIHCGFDLSDREISGDTVFCTDCGSTTPVVRGD